MSVISKIVTMATSGDCSHMQTTQFTLFDAISASICRIVSRSTLYCNWIIGNNASELGSPTSHKSPPYLHGLDLTLGFLYRKRALGLALYQQRFKLFNFPALLQLECLSTTPIVTRKPRRFWFSLQQQGEQNASYSQGGFKLNDLLSPQALACLQLLLQRHYLVSLCGKLLTHQPDVFKKLHQASSKNFAEIGARNAQFW
jgi:hypothetical protein